MYRCAMSVNLSQASGERQKRNDHSVNVLNDNPAFKVECIFVSAPSHQDGDQEAEVAPYLASIARVLSIL